jgi:hypothetical protein
MTVTTKYLEAPFSNAKLISPASSPAKVNVSIF